MTTANELTRLTASEQSRLVASRAISPVDLVAACLERIERFDGALHAFITVMADEAMAAAEEAEREIARGHHRGPLHGIPFGVKDQFAVRGVPTTLGTRAPSGPIPQRDATAVGRLRAAGAILMGTQNLHMLGKGGALSFPFGQPRNPWNLTRTPAGSSSGSGIATAAGMVSLSLGEDTGGSVRAPAAATGLVGLRPTFGRVSRHGGVLFGWNADTIGPITRTVEDAAAVLQVIAGYDPGDALSSRRPVPTYRAGAATSLDGRRIGLVREMTRPSGVDPDPHVEAALEEAIGVLRGLGAVVEEVSLPRVVHAMALTMLTTDVDVATEVMPRWLRDHWFEIDAGIRTRMAASALIPSSIYGRAMRARVLVRNEILDALRRFDALVSPGSLTPPGTIDGTRERLDGADDLARKVMARRITTHPFSVANVPAMVLPMGADPVGLPLSLQIAARPFDEPTLFDIGGAFQHATSWHERRPDVAAAVAAFTDASRALRERTES